MPPPRFSRRAALRSLATKPSRHETEEGAEAGPGRIVAVEGPLLESQGEEGLGEVLRLVALGPVLDAQVLVDRLPVAVDQRAQRLPPDLGSVSRAARRTERRVEGNMGATIWLPASATMLRHAPRRPHRPPSGPAQLRQLHEAAALLPARHDPGPRGLPHERGLRFRGSLQAARSIEGAGGQLGDPGALRLHARSRGDRRPLERLGRDRRPGDAHDPGGPPAGARHRAQAAALVRGGWTGDIVFTDDAAFRLWMASYRRFILHYARMAELEKADLLVVGTELGGLTVHRADWRALIREVRTVYSGPLTYAANWGQEFETLAFWDELDFLGVNFYYPLAAPGEQPRAGSPRLQELERMLEEMSRKHRKPVLFTEVGYAASAAAAVEPWKEENAPLDPADAGALLRGDLPVLLRQALARRPALVEVAEPRPGERGRPDLQPAGQAGARGAGEVVRERGDGQDIGRQARMSLFWSRWSARNSDFEGPARTTGDLRPRPASRLGSILAAGTVPGQVARDLEGEAQDVERLARLARQRDLPGLAVDRRRLRRQARPRLPSRRARSAASAGSGPWRRRSRGKAIRPWSRPPGYTGISSQITTGRRKRTDWNPLRSDAVRGRPARTGRGR